MHEKSVGSFCINLRKLKEKTERHTHTKRKREKRRLKTNKLQWSFLW